MGLELFLRNLKYLTRYNFKGTYNAAHQNTLEQLRQETNLLLNKMVDNIPWELELMPHPNVLSSQETVEALLANDKLSLCRFGDGELYMAFLNQGGVFQQFNPQLAAELKEVLSSRDPNIGVAVAYPLYHSLQEFHEKQRLFFRIHGQQMRQMLQPYLAKDWLYYDSYCSMPYHLFTSIDFAAYFQRFAQLWTGTSADSNAVNTNAVEGEREKWKEGSTAQHTASAKLDQGKDIVVICGKTVFNKIRYNIFDTARSIKYIYGPSANAYDHIDELTEQALQTDPQHTKFIILGHTATVLAYRLAKAGHRAIDVGHLAKDYNSWRMQEQLTTANIFKFYEKD